MSLMTFQDGIGISILGPQNDMSARSLESGFEQGRIHSYPSRVRVGRSRMLKKLSNAKKVIVAKALDGQRYPLPPCEYM